MTQYYGVEGPSITFGDRLTLWIGGLASKWQAYKKAQAYKELVRLFITNMRIVINDKASIPITPCLSEHLRGDFLLHGKIPELKALTLDPNCCDKAKYVKAINLKAPILKKYIVISMTDSDVLSLNINWIKMLARGAGNKIGHCILDQINQIKEKVSTRISGVYYRSDPEFTQFTDYREPSTEHFAKWRCDFVIIIEGMDWIGNPNPTDSELVDPKNWNKIND